MLLTRSFIFPIAAFTLSAALILPASAQDDARDADRMLENFVHYTLIAKPDLAAAWGQKLLESGLNNAELATLLDEGPVSEDRFEEAWRWGLRISELEPIMGEIATRIESGRLDLARNPERIAEALDMLSGTRREEMLGRRRLEAAGEYAVPSLLNQMINGNDQRLNTKCRQVIIDIGRQAVAPLTAALPRVGSAGSVQRNICEMLGSIGYPHAAPALMELAQNESAANDVREAARRAFREVGGIEGTPLAEQYTNLGRQYFNDVASLTAFPYEDRNNIWTYESHVGLVSTPVPTAIYGEVQAMNNAIKAMSIDPASRNARSLFVAANLKRENDLPNDAGDPVFGDMPRSPQFFATVFGTSTAQDVLGMALDRLDTTLVRDAIAALSETTGGSNLFAAGSGRQPLLEAIAYPDRRVQYEAALTLGRALPESRFVGDAQIVPLLASAVGAADASSAVVFASSEESRRVRSTQLENDGFAIAGTGWGVQDLSTVVDQAASVDLAVVQMSSGGDARAVVDGLRNHPRTGATPILVLVDPSSVDELRGDYSSVPQIIVSNEGISEEAMAVTVERLLTEASGGRMTEAEMQIYAIEAIDTLYDIAISDSPAFSIDSAEPAMLEALNTKTDSMRLRVADVVALISTESAQQALFEAALGSSGDEQIDLLERVAASVRHFGNQAAPHQVESIVDLVANAEGDLADAAARVHGALNIFDNQAVILVPKTVAERSADAP